MPAPESNDLKLRLPVISNDEQSFIIREKKRLGLSIEGLFQHWLKEAKASEQ